MICLNIIETFSCSNVLPHIQKIQQDIESMMRTIVTCYIK